MTASSTSGPNTSPRRQSSPVASSRQHGATTDVLMVSGAGRSGTSTVAGMLDGLGMHVPRPVVPADETNPRGFFEPQWVVDFHKRILGASPIVRTIDARPEALDLVVERAGRPRNRRELVEWLDNQSIHERIVVKDPRAFWFHDLWRHTLESRGVRLSFLMMLRHPCEVVKSRDTHYLTGRDERFRATRVSANLAGWCNVMLTAERITRDDPRAFVRYPDLLDDWRVALGRALPPLDLDLDLPGADAPHEVDQFVDAGLRRSKTGWDDYEVSDVLRSLCDRIWLALDELVARPGDRAAHAELDAAREDYEALHELSVAVALDHTAAREHETRREVRRAVKRTGGS